MLHGRDTFISSKWLSVTFTEDFLFYCKRSFGFWKLGSITQDEIMWTVGIQMKWLCDHRSESQFKQLRNSSKKVFWGLNGIRTRGFCVCAAVLHQLSYEDPYTGGRPIYWVHQPVKGVKHRMKWHKLACLQGMGHQSSTGRALQRERRGHGLKSCWSPEKLFFYNVSKNVFCLLVFKLSLYVTTSQNHYS